MIDIKLIREEPDLVRENIRKKFQDHKLPLVDEALALDAQRRRTIAEADELRAARNALSKKVGVLMGQAKKDPSKAAQAEAAKAQVSADAARLKELETRETELEEKLRGVMLVIPQIIDPSVPVGKSDAENVEVRRYGEPVVPDFEIPYHAEIMERLGGLDLDSARRVAGNGFYYLMGDVARLHSAVLTYARDFMIDRGFTYCVPPFMIRGNVVSGVMSFAEMDAMMYKIEGEDLYLIGTSEHSMIGKFIDQILPEEKLPYTLTSYSPCFRKEKGAHGIEERGVYRIHQFEKQEMIVVCRPEDSPVWFDRLWQNTVDLFRSLDIPVRTLECCSGDLADLKVKSVDVEAWSPRQKKYFEVGSCSNLGDAQARRLKIRVAGADGKKYLAHTLNNTVVAPPRMLIAFLENNLQADGSVRIPEVLRPYMGGKTTLEKNGN
ncbi:MAG TPA: serine--tRNA ligase [Oscillospiraceae bacterium]|nr:serine--tRNA ligase [Oscillospiraceae bacterium]